MRTVAPEGDVTSAASPCPTEKKRTTSPLGGPARSAVQLVREGFQVAQRHLGQASQEISERRDDERRTGRGEAEQHRGSHGRKREEVREERHLRHLMEVIEKERRDDRLCGQRGGRGDRDRPRKPRQSGG